MRVLAVRELEHLLERADHQRREVRALFLEPARDRGVIPRRVGERLRREALAGGRRQPAVELAQFGEDRVIALRADHGRDEVEVLGRRANHRWAADVDVLDHLVVGDAAAGGGPLERVQVHAHEIDELDIVVLGRVHVLGVVAHRQQAAVQLRVQRLDPAVHDLREAGQVGDLAHLDPGVGQLARRASGRDDLDPELNQAPGELDEPGLVGDRKQGPGDLHVLGGDRRKLVGARSSLLHNASTLSLDHDAPRIRGVDPHGPERDQPDRLREQLVLDRMQPLEHRVGVDGVGQLDRTLEDHRSGIYPAVDEVHRDPEHFDPVGDRLLDRAAARGTRAATRGGR